MNMIASYLSEPYIRNTYTQQTYMHTYTITNTYIDTFKIPFLSDYDSIPFSRCVDFLNEPYSNEFYLIE